ncbi:MAG TPA: hypothetical protein VKV69_12900 [Actinomycetota bacterium]|nr:hypothetical protein [Actinomycetota bacterium]
MRRGARPSRFLALLISVPLLAACTTSPTVAPGSEPSIGEPPLIFASCAPSPRSITIVAKNIAFNTHCLNARANTPLTIRFVNEDVGVNHNVDILPRPWGYNTPAKAVLFGRIVLGPVTVRYPSNGFPAGLLFMVCYVHHDVMYGLVGVAPIVTPTSGSASTRFHLTWANVTDAPPGYVWDVQVRRPGSATFVDWKRSLKEFGADFVPDAGSGVYSFRVWQHLPARGVIGYSPEVSLTAS